MARNHIIISKEYLLSNPYFIAKASFFFVLSLVQILLVEDDKISKLTASFKGIVAGALYSSKNRKLI
jgi:hypothetical protein